MHLPLVVLVLLLVLVVSEALALLQRRALRSGADDRHRHAALMREVRRLDAQEVGLAHRAATEDPQAR